jgi:hypothetical protein
MKDKKLSTTQIYRHYPHTTTRLVYLIHTSPLGGSCISLIRTKHIHELGNRTMCIYQYIKHILEIYIS